MTSMKRMRPLLGTFVEIGVQSGAGAERALDAAFDAVAEVQGLMSFHDPHSDLSRLNQAGGGEVALHPQIVRVLRLARAMTQASAGLFNCTVGGALVRRGVLPDHGGRAPLDCGKAGDIEIRGTQVRLRRPVRVTLDGIAKGYAVDCAIRAMQRHGAGAGWVNAGGDLRAFGDLALPVHRREMDGSLRPMGAIMDAAIATSCVRVVHDQTYPAWIVGESRAPQVGVWSVLAHTAWRADALTKVAGLADDGERAGLIERLGGRWVSHADGVAACA